MTGYEAIAKKDPTSIRGRRVINDFCLDIRKGVIAKEICVHSEFELLRLLKIADYRKALARCEDGSDMPLSIPETNVTTHIKILLRAGYNLKQSLSEMKKKKVKKYNFPTSSTADKQYISRYSDLSAAERAGWPASVLALLYEKLLH